MQPDPDPALVQISEGSLIGMENGKANWSDSRDVSVHWDNNSGRGNAAARDKSRGLKPSILCRPSR